MKSTTTTFQTTILDRMRYYTADWHIGHENIIFHCDRPFSNTHDMQRAIVDAMSRLDPTDELYILGDVTGPGQDVAGAMEVMAQIPAQMYWLLGNHDPTVPTTFGPHAMYVGQRHTIRTDRTFPSDRYNGEGQGYNVSIVLDHYPLDAWNGHYHGHLHLHGHVHGRSQNVGRRRMDVGVDPMDFRPVSEDEVFRTLMDVPAPKDGSSS